MIISVLTLTHFQMTYDIQKLTLKKKINIGLYWTKTDDKKLLCIFRGKTGFILFLH